MNRTQQNTNQKKAGVDILISDKIVFKVSIITRDEKTFHRYKWISSTGRYYNFKSACSQKYSLKIKQTLTELKKRPRNMSVSLRI